MKNRKTIIVSVLSDLVSDQRIHRVALYLQERNLDVIVLGRSIAGSPEMPQRPYPFKRIHCFFTRGALQYAEFNLKLFFRLLFLLYDLLLSNDLDTLLPNKIAAALKRKPLVYDSHEYFTGMPTLDHKPFTKKIWRFLEKKLLPGIKHAYTVNDAIAELYAKETGISMKTVRNLPSLRPYSTPSSIAVPLPQHKTILIMQGGGINPQQGYEEAVLAMQYLPDHYLLLIVGGGLLWDELQSMVHELALREKVLMIPRVPFEQLSAITRRAHLGLCLTLPVCVNHILSLPNKLFDYIHAEIPVLATDVPEVKQIIENYEVGKCISALSPQTLAIAIEQIFAEKEGYDKMKKQAQKAKNELNWELEKTKLDEVYGPLLG